MQPLLLLHGAIGSMDQFTELKKALADYYTIYSINFSGHGGLPIVEKDFSIKLFADDVLTFLEKNNIEKINIFGYSMGGYVGMYLAKNYPDKINKLATLATKFNWNEKTAEKESRMLNAEKIEEKLPAFAQALAERHRPQDWKFVLHKTVQLLLQIGTDNPLKLPDYNSIQLPVKLMLGDRDKMVSLDETIQVYQALPNAQLCILPSTAHPIEAVDTGRLAYAIRDFMN